MPTFETIQYRFSQGEMTPNMIGRTDLEQSTGALARCKNGWTSAEGWVSRRPGLEHVGMVQLAGETVTGVIDNSPDNTNPNVRRPNDANVTSTLTYTFSEPIFVGDLIIRGATVIPGQPISPNTNIRYVYYIDYITDDDPNNFTFVSAGPIGALNLDDTNEVIFRDTPFGVGRSVKAIRFRILESPFTTDSRFRIKGTAEAEVLADPDTTVNMYNFIFNRDQTYIMVLVRETIFIYRKNELGITVLVDTLSVPRLDTDDKVASTHAVYAGDTMLLFQEDTAPYIIRRMGSHTNWSASDLEFENIPNYVFGEVTSIAGMGTLTASNETGNITITSTASVFTEAMVGQFVCVTINNIGRARITGFNSATSVNATVIDEFSATSVPPAQWEIQTGYEPIWSETRGYPRRATFHENRLWIDGGKSLPSLLYFSKVNDFYNFDFGTGILATDAGGPAVAGLSRIEAIVSQRSLVVFTGDAEYIVPQTLGEPITPQNFSLVKQGNEGIEANLFPVESNSGIYYVKRDARSIQEFTYPESVDAVPINRSVSILSSHLIKGIKDFALRREIDTAEGAYLMMVRDDGGLTIGNVLAEQQVASFFDIETVGFEHQDILGSRFIACISDNEDMYFVIQRGNDLFIERFNFDITLDSSNVFNYNEHYQDDTFTVNSIIRSSRFSNASAKVVVNMPSENKWIDYGIHRVVIDRSNNTYSISNPIPISAGELPDDAVIIVGYDYDVEITDMPTDVPQNQFAPTTQSRKLQITEVSLRLIDSADTEVSPVHSNSRPVSFIQNSEIDSNVLTKVAKSDTVRKSGFKGWGDDGQITITQGSPFPMKISQIKKRIRSR